MTIIPFSNKRGIYSLFKGYGEKAYIFLSSFYGAVGYADVDSSNGCKNIIVKIYLCNGSRLWCWSLENIIKRGIKKFETRFVKDKNIKFKVRYIDSFRDYLTPNYEDNVFEFSFDLQKREGCKLVRS